MTLPRIVENSNRLDLRRDPSLALQSILLELGFDQAEDLVKDLKELVRNNSLRAWIKLPVYLGVPGLSTCASVFLYLLKLQDLSALQSSVFTYAPPYTSGATRVFKLLDSLTADNYEELLQYFNYTPLAVPAVIAEPFLYLEWLEQNEPATLGLVTALRQGKLAEGVMALVSRRIGDNVLTQPRKYTEIRHWVQVSFSDTVLGADYLQ